MLRSRIVPVLLLRGNGLVKTRGFSDPKYIGDPINAVKIFNEKEADELTILDIDATTTGKGPNLKMLQDIASESRMPLCYGGGVQSADMAAEIISFGYEKISISHAAIVRPALVAEISDRIGRQSVVVTIDIRKEGVFSSNHVVYSLNGKHRHSVDPISFATQCADLGAGEIVINSIDRDGAMRGYDMELARRLHAAVSVPIMVLGGAGSIDDLRDLTQELGPVGAGVGSLFVLNGKYRAVLISYARP